MTDREIIADHLAFALQIASKQNNALLAYLIEMAFLENEGLCDSPAPKKLQNETHPGPSVEQLRSPRHDHTESTFLFT